MLNQFLPVCIKDPAGECPTWTLLHGPGEDVGINPAGLGTCIGFKGLLATRPEPGEGCGSMLGVLGGSDGGDAKLKEVAGLLPKLWCWFVYTKYNTNYEKHLVSKSSIYLWIWI